MESKSSSVFQIDEFHMIMNEGSPLEKEAFLKLIAELTSEHKALTYKEIFRGLHRKIKTENNKDMANIYRNILEMMIRPYRVT